MAAALAAAVAAPRTAAVAVAVAVAVVVDVVVAVAGAAADGRLDRFLLRSFNQSNSKKLVPPPPQPGWFRCQVGPAYAVSKLTEFWLHFDADHFQWIALDIHFWTFNFPRNRIVFFLAKALQRWPTYVTIDNHDRCHRVHSW